MLVGSVEVVSRLVEFELSLTGGGRRSGQQLSDLILAHGFELTAASSASLRMAGDSHPVMTTLVGRLMALHGVKRELVSKSRLQHL